MRQVGLLIVTVALMAVTAGPATAAPPTCTNPAVTCYTGTAEDGSTFKAEVPPDWNGTLLLYSHGYVPPFVPNPPADTWRNRAVADHLLAEGFALAGSSYASNGWAVEEALRDQIDLLERFEDRFGEPRRDDRLGRVDGRHDHRRARPAAPAALRRRAAVLRDPRRSRRALEPEPRPRSTRSRRCCRPTRTPPSRCPPPSSSS